MLPRLRLGEDVLDSKPVNRTDHTQKKKKNTCMVMQSVWVPPGITSYSTQYIYKIGNRPVAYGLPQPISALTLRPSWRRRTPSPAAIGPRTAATGASPPRPQKPWPEHKPCPTRPETLPQTPRELPRRTPCPKRADPRRTSPLSSTLPTRSRA